MSKGFTLIEVLVVIAITALLAGLILTYSSSSRDQVAISVEQARLAQTVSRAKGLTVSTYNQPDVPCGYGVHFDYPNNAYTIFAYDPSSCTGISQLDPTAEKIIDTQTLPGNLKLGNPDTDNQAIGDILFVPPNPDTEIWLYGQTSTSTEGHAQIAAKSGAISAAVTVSNAGQISFSK